MTALVRAAVVARLRWKKWTPARVAAYFGVPVDAVAEVAKGMR